MQARGPPMQPERVARKRHEQGPHPKREPARRQQASHAGIDERVAGAARLPGGEPLWHNVTLPQAVGRPQHVFKLDRRLVLQLLHEVAMPVEPRLHALEAPQPGLALCLLPRALGRRESGLHVEPPSLARLPHPPHRDRAKRECGAQSGAARRGRHRATDATGIVAATPVKKILEHLACRPFAPPLPVFRVLRHAELAAPENAERAEPLDDIAPAATGAARHADARGCHPFFPESVPAVSRREPPHHTGLRHFEQLDAGRPRPASDAPVAGIGHARACLLVGHEEPKACLVLQLFETRHRLAPPRDKPDALLAEGGLEVHKAFGLKRRVTRIPFGLREHLRLVKKHRKHGAASGPGHRLRERGVIVHAEIALEPDTDRRAEVGHDDRILFTQDSGPAGDTRRKYRRGPHPGLPWKSSCRCRHRQRISPAVWRRVRRGSIARQSRLPSSPPPREPSLERKPGEVKARQTRKRHRRHHPDRGQPPPARNPGDRR